MISKPFPPLALHCFGLCLLAVFSAHVPLFGEETVTATPVSGQRLGGAQQQTEAQIEAKVRQGGRVARTVSGFSIDTASRRDVIEKYHRHYQTSLEYADNINWTGDVSTCQPGTVSTAFLDDTLRRVNYFRAMAGLPSDITFDPVKNAKSQEAALVFARQNDLSHSPSTDFPGNACLTADAQEAAGASNLSLGSFGPYGIDRLILDDGANNVPVGHRRWFYYPRAQEMGHGSVPFNLPDHNAASVTWVIGDFKSSAPSTEVPWPNEGYIPYHLVPGDGQTHPRWSFSYPGADFSSSTVSMTRNGSTISVTLEPVQTGFGDNTIVWKPSGVVEAPPADGTDDHYEVTISGITSAPFASKSYDVYAINPNDLQEEVVVSGPGTASSDGTTSYSFSPVTDVDGYTLRVAQTSDSTLFEGAESSPEPQVSGGPTIYNLTTSDLAKTGSRSFHLAFPDFETQQFQIDRTFIPQSSSRLNFSQRFRFFTTQSELRAEASKDGGATWITLWSRNGDAGSSSDSSVTWETSWQDVSEPFPSDLLGQTVTIRFVAETSGSAYIGSNQYYGCFIDDVEITNATEFVTTTTTALSSGDSTFNLTGAAAGVTLDEGQKFLVQVAPQLAGHTFVYGPAIDVTVTAALSLSPAQSWRNTHFGTTEDVGDAADDADPDGDLLTNIVERALGGDPTDGTGAMGTDLYPVASTERPEASLADRLVLSVSLPTAGSPDTTFEVEMSDDLTTWTVIARKIGPGGWNALNGGAVITEAPSGGRQTVRVGDAVTLSSTTEPRFLRLEVSE
ncbi:MAG: hypothetical protein AAF514_13640 [Verrucomicrobiota bacterium]